MSSNLVCVLILSVICTVCLGEPGVHTLRIRFPGPSSDKVVLPKPAQQNIAPYPAAGYKPEPVFELPQSTYLPPTEPELTYGPPSEPQLTYGPPSEPELTYGPPAEVYGPPAEPELFYDSPADTYELPELTYEPPKFNDFPQAAVVNAPLTLATQFTPPRPNKAATFRPLRPQTANIVNKPLKPVNHLTVPSPQRVVAFRPRRPQVQSQQLYPKTYLTLPRVERVIEFRPRRVPHQQQANFLSRPLPTSIFGKSKNGQTGRQLPSKIFSN